MPSVYNKMVHVFVKCVMIIVIILFILTLFATLDVLNLFIKLII